MAEIYTLEAEPRTIVGKQVNRLRRQGIVPAVIYGLNQPLSISCAYRPLEILLKKAGSTHLVKITVNGQQHDTLVREVQRDKIRRDILHVDFQVVDLTKTLRTEVQIVLVNVPKLGAEYTVAHPISAVMVECLPTAIPEVIRVDASGLKRLGDRLTIANLPKLEGVTYLADEHDIIARVESLTTADVAEGEEGEAVAAEPEVIEKGKKEEEDF